MKSLVQSIHIKNTCEQFNIHDYTVNNDGSIDVRGNVNISRRGLKQIPLRFNKVSGNFKCHTNYLTSLIGCPKEVGGDFDCSYNCLTSLIGCPKEVGGEFGGDFYFNNNQLTTLEGSPDKVLNFRCSYNILTSLYGCPTKIVGKITHYSNSNSLDQVFLNTLASQMIPEQRNIFYKYQSYYEVWTPELNIENMNSLVDDIKDGLE